MYVARTSRHRPLIGTALLALWLGWVAVALMPAAPRWQGDADAAEDLLRGLVARLPIDAASGPLAIRLATGGAGDVAWHALEAGIAEHGGRAIEVEPGGRTAGFEVLILAPGGRAVYAGPLVPETGLCGAGPAAGRLRQWLPQLLARTGAPLLFASS